MHESKKKFLHFFSIYYTKYKKIKLQCFKLLCYCYWTCLVSADSEQKPRVCRWCKYLVASHNCMGENDTINDQVLKIHSSNNRKLKIKAVRNTDNCFTISQYKTEEPEHMEISTLISLEVWLFCCETSMLFHNLKWLPPKLVIKSMGL